MRLGDRVHAILAIIQIFQVACPINLRMCRRYANLACSSISVPYGFE